MPQGRLVSSVVIRSEQLHRFQRLCDPWQRQTSGQNQELFAGASSLLDQRSRVNMALSTPGSPRRDRINQAVLQPGREISPHRRCLRRGSNTSRRAAQRGLGDRSGNTGLIRVASTTVIGFVDYCTTYEEEQGRLLESPRKVLLTMGYRPLTLRKTMAFTME